MTTLTDHQRGQLPAAILRQAAKTQRPDEYLAVYYLTRRSGHSIASAARECDVPYRTACNWAKGYKELEDQVQSASEVSSTVQELTADEVVAERRRLYEEARAAGKLDLQQRILADESKRHGLEVQRVEQTSLVVQLQQLTPDARAAEIAARMQRLGLASADPGDPPQPGGARLILDDLTPQTQNLENDAKALPPSSGATGEAGTGTAPGTANDADGAASEEELGQGSGLAGASGAEGNGSRVTGAGDASCVSDTSDTSAQED